MNKRLSGVTISFFVAMVIMSCLCFKVHACAASTKIDSIKMDVFIDSEGNANIEEVWQASVYEGTQGYRPYGNLMNCEIKDFYVTDEKGVVYHYEDYWNKDGDFYNKAHKCGINDIGEKKELCWGISEYGNRTYTLHYTITNIINQYKDCQGLYFSFMPREMKQEPDSAVITIHSDIPFNESNSKIWAFGYPDGTIQFENGTIVMNSNGKLSPDNYMTTLIKINKNHFIDANPINKSFDEVYNEAMEGAKSSTDKKPIDYVISVLILFCAIIGICLWYAYGRDDKPVESVEFYPPDGLNSAELAFMYNGEVINKDIVSLVVYLASKGYLAIEEFESTALFSTKKGFRFVKLKEYDGFNEIERRFFNRLFSVKSVVTKEDLQYKFYMTINEIMSDMNSTKNKKKIFEASSLHMIWPVAILLVIMQVLIVARPMISAYGILPFSLSFSFPVATIFVLQKTAITFRGKMSVKIVIALIVIVVCEGPAYGMILAVVNKNLMFLVNFLLGLVGTVVLMIVLKYITKRNAYGVRILGKIRGFKRFLEFADKEKLEALVMENPMYFYDILPYTYVLGISEKWMDKFEEIACEPPDWYHGYHDSMFSMAGFSAFMQSTMESANTAMTSAPSSDGDGGGSFSGGGGGAGSSSGGGFC